MRTTEFDRVFNLPRRAPFTSLSPAEQQEYVDVTTWHFKTPHADPRESLFPIQAYTLCEFVDNKGAIAALPVGSGKTLISLLAATAVNAKRPLLITRAQLKAKTISEIMEDQVRGGVVVRQALCKNWRVPIPKECGGTLTIMSYEALSRDKQHEVLFDIMPDYIGCDEAHKVRHKNAAWKRIERFADQYPDVPFLFESASLINRDPSDFAHMMLRTLKDRAPVPVTFQDLRDWGEALEFDPKHDKEPIVHPGALCLLGEPIREGFRKRLVESPGVIVLDSPSTVRASLTIQEVTSQIEVPDEIEDAFVRLRTTWETPGGELITTALEFARHAQEMILGFYYRWVWPENKPDFEWLLARRAWRQLVRHTIRYGKHGIDYDTELQVWNAVAASKVPDVAPPSSDLGIQNPFHTWSAIKDRVEPKTEAVWLSEYMVDFAEEWVNRKPVPTKDSFSRHGGGICWVAQDAVFQKLRERLGVERTFGGGDDHISKQTGEQSIVASVHAHREGKNLQAFNRALVLSAPPGGQGWEQMMGRMHREGQMADEVSVEVMFHCVEQWNAFQQALRDARYAQETQGMRQKLLYADTVLETTQEIAIERAKALDPFWTKELSA